MPHISNGKKSPKSYSQQPVSKIILIELSTLLLGIAFTICKTVLFLWPEYVDVPSMYDLLVTYPFVLKNSPACLGMLLSFLTWHIMYLDSETPGINPPTPLSPVKYRVMSGANFHLNYMFAITIGPLMSLLLYTGWV